MIKHFCDVCGCEIERNYVTDRFEAKRLDIEIEILVTKDSVSNQGDLCRKCLLEIVNNYEVK